MSLRSDQQPILFEQMDLAQPIQVALKKMKFETPTPIQVAAIPIAQQGRDIVGCAQTGTGKTAAFGIPLVEKLLMDASSAALILAPTRELAVQIHDFLKKLTFGMPMKSALLIGGTHMHAQLRDLARKPQIIVATPGRLMDHVRRRSANLNNVKMLVLDEGDRMLDMGFEPQIIAILEHVPKERQVLLFSATMPERIRKLVKKYMNNPQTVSVGTESQPVDKITHSILQITRANKNDTLIDTLNARLGSVLIFVNTKHGTDKLTTYLADCGYSVSKIHGGRSQGQRNQALLGFRSKKFRVLVATDVAARGLDVPHIEHVINYDLPKDVDDYVHRIGRTARAGAAGEAICLITNEDRMQWNRISRMYKLGHAINDPRERGREDRPQSKRSFSSRFERSERSDRSDRPQRTERPSRFARNERLERPSRFARAERTERPERAERSERWAKPDRWSDKPEREERPRFAKADRPARADAKFERSERSSDRSERTFGKSASGRLSFGKPFKKNQSKFFSKQKRA